MAYNQEEEDISEYLIWDPRAMELLGEDLIVDITRAGGRSLEVGTDIINRHHATVTASDTNPTASFEQNPPTSAAGSGPVRAENNYGSGSNHAGYSSHSSTVTLTSQSHNIANPPTLEVHPDGVSQSRRPMMLDTRNLTTGRPSEKLAPRWEGRFKALKASSHAVQLNLPANMRINNTFLVTLVGRWYPKAGGIPGQQATEQNVRANHSLQPTRHHQDHGSTLLAHHARPSKKTTTMTT